MCGIAGAWGPEGRRDATAAEVLRMCAALHRRGPDGRQQGSFEGVVLGHARLAIIDLATGDQPQAGEDGQVVVVVNGEIYDYVETRRALEADGARFRTMSDIEVVPHLYERYGDDFVHHLRGMFAVALYDRRRRRLVLARDRLGKKPIYWMEREDRFYFASEPKALLEVPGARFDIDHAALDAFLTYQYVPSPLTPFRQVRKLPAASMLIREGGRNEIREYWRPPLGEARSISDERALEEVAATLDEATAIRLRADVPLGAFLSSGIDSTLVVSSAVRASSRPLGTTTIVFDDDDAPEARRAAALAARLGTRHRERRVEADLAASIESVAAYLDEPLGDSSTIPTFLVSKAVREDYKVAISGDGGDETFGGYAWRYWQNLTLDRWRRRIPAFLRRTLVGGVARAYPKLDRFPKPMRLKWGLRNLSLDAEEAYFLDMSIFRPEDKLRLYTGDFARAVGEVDAADHLRRHIAAVPERDLLTRLLYADLKTYLADGVNAKVDRMSMANSLEVRSPLLDQRMVELAFSLPSDLKMRGKTSKWLLRRLASDRVGNEIAGAPKRGFAPPLGRWLRKDLREAYLSTVLSGSARVTDLVDRGALERMFADHVEGRRDHARPLWLLFVLENWFRHFGRKASGG